jgi:hypothetical protein
VTEPQYIRVNGLLTPVHMWTVATTLPALPEDFKASDTPIADPTESADTPLGAPHYRKDSP